MDELYNNIYCAGYLILWILTFIGYHFMAKRIDSGSAIIGTYILYGIFSLITLNDPIFSSNYKELKIFPYIYLYVMILISMSPIIYQHCHYTKEIEDPKTRMWTILGWVIAISAVLMLPTIISNFGTGIVKLFTDSDAGKDAYMEQVEGAESAGGKIRNLPAVIFNALSDFCVFIFFYLLTQNKKKKLLIIALFCAMMIAIIIPITNGQRGGVIMEVMTIIGGYMLFRQYINRKINKVITKIGVILMITVSLPIAAITMSRFSSVGPSVSSFLTWYVGQGSLYFNNYGLDDGGIRNGDRTINLFKRIVVSDTPKNYTERREKYHNLEIDDDLFSTFVGDFTIDFGPIAAFIIFLIFNTYILSKIRQKDEMAKLDKLLLVYFAICVNMQGGMALFSFSDTANLRLIVFAFIYAYQRYHELLLEKFPLKETSYNEKLIDP